MVIGSGNARLIHAAKRYEKDFEVGALKTSSYGKTAIVVDVWQT